MKTDLFQSCGHCWVFQICWHIECSTFMASSIRILNSSTGIPSPPLALFIVMLPKAHLTSYSRMSGSRWVITPSRLSGSWRSFLYSSSLYSCLGNLQGMHSSWGRKELDTTEQLSLHSPWPQYWKRSGFIPIPKKGNAKEVSNYCTIALISHASKVILKILQARLQQYMNQELPHVQAGFRKGRRTRDQIANIRWIIVKARGF